MIRLRGGCVSDHWLSGSEVGDQGPWKMFEMDRFPLARA